MSKSYDYGVPVKVAIAQTRVTINEMESPVNREGVEALSLFIDDPQAFIETLKEKFELTRFLESEQEQAKAEYVKETSDDQVLGKKAYLFCHRVQTRIRQFLFKHPEVKKAPLRIKFRFGKVKNDSPRTVSYELLIILSEIRKVLVELPEAKLSDQLLAEGESLLAQLDKDRKETDRAKEIREDLTRKVNEAEGELCYLLRELEIADQAVAMEHPENRQWFPLDIIATEKGRVAAAHKSLMDEEVPQEVINN